MDSTVDEIARFIKKVAHRSEDVETIGGALSEHLDRGSRTRETARGVVDDSVERGTISRIRRYPTNCMRLNRALTELDPSAFKIHLLLWQWRGAPARGTLPYFTIHSLSKFCNLTRPTVRKGLTELISKGWISKAPYNVHHKNALYRLVAIRKVRLPGQ